MYGDYKEHWSMVDERMNSAVHENYPEWKKSKRSTQQAYRSMQRDIRQPER